METYIISIGPDHTRAIGRVVGEYAAAGDVVLLTGELGAGKTCLTQGILHGLGSDELARSPTFVLITEYSARIPFYHIDLYRLSSARHAEDLGIDEYLDGGMTVVEWADNAREVFPSDALEVRIDHVSETERRLRFTDPSDRFKPTLEAIRRLEFTQ